MKFIEDEYRHIIELSRRNLTTLLAKLDDPLSNKTLIAPGDRIMVKAVADEEHYASRPPGEIYMPSSGETI